MEDEREKAAWGASVVHFQMPARDDYRIVRPEGANREIRKRERPRVSSVRRGVVLTDAVVAADDCLRVHVRRSRRALVTAHEGIQLSGIPVYDAALQDVVYGGGLVRSCLCCRRDEQRTGQYEKQCLKSKSDTHRTVLAELWATPAHRAGALQFRRLPGDNFGPSYFEDPDDEDDEPDDDELLVLIGDEPDPAFWQSVG